MGDAAAPSCLVVHDGELGDVCALLTGLGLAFTERRGAPTREDGQGPLDLVLATPRRLLELRIPHSIHPVRIAILDKDSKTLRAMLQRAAVDVTVRRPVHPAALRLLVLHSLYRGPEKRSALRVGVGAPVRFRTGLRGHQAILADLSVTGCRLLSPQPLDAGRKLSIKIPAEVAEGRGFGLSGHVVRCSDPDERGDSAVAVSFGAQPERVAKKLRAAVAAHRSGPAVLPAGVAPLAGGVASGAPAVRSPNGRALSRAYERHVAALGIEAARVLIGHEVSLSGMRVDPHPDVGVGDDLELGLHLRGRDKPLVLSARVARDDGERGLDLEFRDLGAESRDYLERMVNFLPIIAMRDDENDESIVVSEILDHQPVEKPPEA